MFFKFKKNPRERLTNSLLATANLSNVKIGEVKTKKITDFQSKRISSSCKEPKDDR